MHLRNEGGGKIERQRRGCLKFLVDQEKRCCVILVTKGRLGIASLTTKQVQSKTCKLLYDIIVRRALREARLGAQVRQRKPIVSCKHVLTCLRFVQRYEN